MCEHAFADGIANPPAVPGEFSLYSSLRCPGGAPFWTVYGHSVRTVERAADNAVSSIHSGYTVMQKCYTEIQPKPLKIVYINLQTALAAKSRQRCELPSFRLFFIVRGRRTYPLMIRLINACASGHQWLPGNNLFAKLTKHGGQTAPLKLYETQSHRIGS